MISIRQGTGTLPGRPVREFLLPLLAAISLVLAFASTRAGAADLTPGQLVQANSTRLLHALTARRAEFKAHPDALHAFVQGEFAQIFDRVYSARLVLGRNARDASDADVRGFSDAMAENLMNRYGNSLLQVDPGLQVRVTSEVPLRGGSIVKVMSQVDRKTGTPVAMDYLLHQNGGQWQVFDVIVEGVSFVQTFRTQFGEELQSKSLAQITSDLRLGKIRLHGESSTNMGKR